MRVLRPFSVLLIFAIGSAIVGCSSSTSPNTPAPSAMLVVPASIDMGSASIAHWHDVTYTIANTGTDSAVITGFHFSAAQTTGSMAKDTVDILPFTLGVNKSATFHVEFYAADSGAQTVTDTIVYTTAGQSRSTTSSVHVNGTYVDPQPGSTFTYDSTGTDTNGVASGHYLTTTTVLATNVSIGGKSGVVEMLSGGGDTSYFHVETNGDVSEYFPGQTIDLNGTGITAAPIVMKSNWLVQPFGTHTAQSVTIYDSTTQGTVQYNGVPITVQIHVTATSHATYGGSEVVSAASTTFNTERDTNVTTFRIQIGVGTTTIVDQSELHTAEIWYSPKIRALIKQNGTVQPHGTTKTSSSSEILQSYKLQ